MAGWLILRLKEDIQFQPRKTIKLVLKPATKQSHTQSKPVKSSCPSQASYAETESQNPVHSCYGESRNVEYYNHAFGEAEAAKACESSQGKKDACLPHQY